MTRSPRAKPRPSPEAEPARQAAPERPWPEPWDALAAALPFLALCAMHLGYQPIWDGQIYWECVLDAERVTLSPTAYNCASHPTMAYLWPLGVLLHLTARRYAVVIAFNALLGVLALRAFATLAARALPGPERRLERALLTACVGLCPVITSGALQLTPDYGMTVFALCALAAMAQGELRAAAAWGVAATLSKEPGVLVYTLGAGAYALTHVLRPRGDRASKLAALRAHAVLLAPPALAVAGVVALRAGAGEGAFWRGAGSETPLWRQLASFSLLDDVLPATLAMVFVANFMWAPTLLALAGAARGGASSAARWVFGEPSARPPSGEARGWPFALWTLLGCALALTRFRTYLNVRYFMPLFPLLILAAGRGAGAVGLGAEGRVAVAAGLALALGASNFDTHDPLSRSMFGVFRFGDHAMLKVTSLTRECCGHGRDQLVYNLQFTRLQALLDEALPRALAEPGRGVAVNRLADWYLINHLDRETHRPAPPSARTEHPVVWTWSSLSNNPGRPRALAYIATPNMPDEEAELALLRRLYDVGPPQVVARGGYALTWYALTAR